MAESRRYDGELQMFVESPKTPKLGKLKFFRKLARVRGDAWEHPVAGPSGGIFADMLGRNTKGAKERARREGYWNPEITESLKAELREILIQKEFGTEPDREKLQSLRTDAEAEGRVEGPSTGDFADNGSTTHAFYSQYYWPPLTNNKKLTNEISEIIINGEETERTITSEPEQAGNTFYRDAKVGWIYDADLQMFKNSAKPNFARLRFLRWLAERGLEGPIQKGGRGEWEAHAGSTKKLVA